MSATRTSPATGGVSIPATPDTLNHYVKKASITESIVFGASVKALCGTTFVVSSQGGGNVSAPGAEDCVLCGIIYAGLPEGPAL